MCVSLVMYRHTYYAVNNTVLSNSLHTVYIHKQDKLKYEEKKSIFIFYNVLIF